MAKQAAKNGIKSAADPPRDKKGRFTGGNPGGGRPKMPDELREAFRDLTIKARDTLVEIMCNPDAKESARVRCAEIILERGWGKPEQAVSIETTKTDVGVVLIPARTDG